MRKKRGTDYYVNRHSCFLLQYHLVLVTKYRHPVLTGPVREAVYERVRYVADSRGFRILEINGEADYLHILMEADAVTSPAELANVIKTQTARRARKLTGKHC
ncbi:MAG: IS200/IS605 family transposase [Lachnospiraceae bacterium]